MCDCAHDTKKKRLAEITSDIGNVYLKLEPREPEGHVLICCWVISLWSNWITWQGAIVQQSSNCLSEKWFTERLCSLPWSHHPRRPEYLSCFHCKSLGSVSFLMPGLLLFSSLRTFCAALKTGLDNNSLTIYLLQYKIFHYWWYDF